jgi:hypothetical protein
MTRRKICTYCGKLKATSAYGKKGAGLNHHCKDCDSIKQQAFAKTPHGRAVKAWNLIKYRVRNPYGKNKTYVGVELRMTRDEFMTWAVPAYTAWVTDGNLIESASVDRKEDGHYAIGNLQIISRVENAKKQKRNKNVHAPAGHAWCPSCVQYKLKCEFYTDKASWNGVSCRCRQCHNQYHRNYYRQRQLSK